MSTQINIVVNSGGLLKRNADQTLVNRQAKLTVDVQAKAAEEGKAELEKRRLQQSLDPLTGKPLGGNNASKIRRIDQEPAAYRQLRDIFAIFSANVIFPPGSGVPTSMRVVSGNGSSVAEAPWPTVADFPDLLLQDAPAGELTGQGAAGFEFPLLYDDLGRLLGSTNPPSPPNLPLPALVWDPSRAAFEDDGLAGTMNRYEISAVYGENNFDFKHILPVDRYTALVVFRAAKIKTATTRVIRIERNNFLFENPNNPDDPFNCEYWKSPLSYKQVNSYIEDAEEFHAFVVSATKARYLGIAPGPYVSAFKALPEYKRESSERPVSLFPVQTYNNWMVTNDARCSPGDQPITEQAEWSLGIANGNRYDRLSVRGLNSYKLVRGGSAVTPAAYSVFTNPNFSQPPPGEDTTDDYVKSFVPSFAGSLKWRTDDDDGTPYTFQGPSPESWSTFSGPSPILSGFPNQWRKSGRANNPTFQRDVAWDWNNPAYCRQQALALGFTEADLIP